ncbi:MAG TPA: hypothetical protein DCZ04_13780 [Syntrophorhabdus aromaticivorans]|nr:hypothetical protein [Syntrophorhabdus aromaticivorans]
MDEPVAHLLKDRGVACYLVDADGIAAEKGMMQASNMALIGFFSRLGVGPYTAENMESMIKRRVKAKLVEKNLEVFRAGYGYEKG